MVHLLEWLREEREEAQVADYRVEPRERRRGDEEEAGSSKLTTFEKNKRAEE